NPSYSQTEWNHVYNDMERVYLVTLAKSTKSPLAPKSDEVKLEEEKKEPEKPKTTPPDVNAADKPDAAKPEAKGDEKKDPKPAEKKEKVVVKVDADGLPQRITVLPPAASGYRALSSVGDKLYYLKKGKLFLFEIEKEKETEIGDVAGYRISANQKKMLVKVGADFAIVDLPSG